MFGILAWCRDAITRVTDPKYKLKTIRNEAFESINTHPRAARFYKRALEVSSREPRLRKDAPTQVRVTDADCEFDELARFYEKQSTLSMHTLARIANNEELVGKIVRMPAIDALASGYKINWADSVVDEHRELIEKRLTEFESDMVIREAIENERVFGLGAVLPIYNCFGEYGELDTVSESRLYKTTEVTANAVLLGFRAVGADKLSFSDFVTHRVLSTKYEQATTVRYGDMSIDADMFIWLHSRKEFGVRGGYDAMVGQSIVAQIAGDVYAWRKATKISLDLLNTKRDKVLTMKKDNYENAVCWGDGGDATAPPGTFVDDGRAYLSAISDLSNDDTTVLMEGDSLSVLQTTLSDVPRQCEFLRENIAVVTQIPVTKLFGVSPAGMNSTGESDMKNYNQYLKSIQTDLVAPTLHKMIKIIADIEGVSEYDCSIEFNPIDAPTQGQVVDTFAKQTDALVKLVTSDIMTLQEARDMLNKTEGNGVVGLEDLDEAVYDGMGETYGTPASFLQVAVPEIYNTVDGNLQPHYNKEIEDIHKRLRANQPIHSKHGFFGEPPKAVDKKEGGTTHQVVT